MNDALVQLLNDWDGEIRGMMEFLYASDGDALVAAEIRNTGILLPGATEHAIGAAEARLGRRPPPSVKAFYSHTNGLLLPGAHGIREPVSIERLELLEKASPFDFKLVGRPYILSAIYRNKGFGTWRERIYALSHNDSIKYALIAREGGDPEWNAASIEFSGGIGAKRHPSLYDLLVTERAEQQRSFRSMIEGPNGPE